MSIKIRTAAGNECFIEENDLKHYPGAEILATDVEVPTDAVPEEDGDEE